MDSAENGVIMKKKCLLPALLFFFIGTFLETDRVVDMRAYSRQRGFKAYQAGQNGRAAVSGAIGRKQSGDSAIGKKEAAVKPVEKKQPVSKEQSDQTDEIQQYIEDNPQVRPDI